MSKILEDWEVLPHGRLEAIDDGILTVTGEIRMPLGNFPRRMTVVALCGHRTAIYSAIALDEPQMAEIEALGRPSFLIVPGDAHRLDAKIWKKRYPDIAVLAPPGAQAKVAEAVPVDATSDILADPDVRFQVVAGAEGHEAVLVVRKAGGTTLICNDIIANVAHPHGIGASIMSRLFGFGVSEPHIPWPVAMRIIDDKPALAAQFRSWAAEPGLRRLIVSHGDPIESGAKDVLMTLADSLDA